VEGYVIIVDRHIVESEDGKEIYLTTEELMKLKLYITNPEPE